MKNIIILSGLLNFCAVEIYAMTLDEYMSLILQKNKLVNSYDALIEAAKEKKIAGDLSLAPVLTAAHNKTVDKSVTSTVTVAEKRDTTATSLGLSKNFSTGTTLSLTAQTNKYENEQPVTPGNNGYSNGALGIRLQQSLWKDFFGIATKLRRDRESATYKLETLGYELKKRLTLIEFESDFWDYVVAHEDLKLKQANYDRAKKLDAWTANRVYNGISDQSDLFQVRALASLRELELDSARDIFKSKEIKIKENIGLAQNESVPVLTANLAGTGNYIADLAQKKNVIKIESYLASLEAEVKQKVSEEVRDSLKPDLALIGQYNTSSFDLEYSEMLKNINRADKPTTFVGLSFSWVFGSDAKSAKLSTAKKEALAAKYRAEQFEVGGKNSWKEHLRRYDLTKKNILILENIARLQRERAKAEQLKFSKGRTITSNVVNAETDAAQAEVNYLIGKSGLRKLEAATQQFIALED